MSSLGVYGVTDARILDAICQEPISTTAGFEDFKFSNPRFGGSVYITLLRSFEPSDVAEIVFSHRDLRPENILVQPDQHGHFTTCGIIDWEKSGFCLAYFECAKATSNLSALEEDDWYLYLPPYVSPTKYPLRWLLDRLSDIHVA